jgi:NTP pyrophosphatase (non-canonical NTP hydrolase)
MADILTLQRDAHQNSVDHGFWEASQDIPTKLMLIVTEVAEAMEAYRKGDMEIYHSGEPVPGSQISVSHNDEIIYTLHGSTVSEADVLPNAKPEGFPVEIADIVIRCMDLAGWLGFDLGAVVELKMAYNSTRPKLHGRKL